MTAPRQQVAVLGAGRAGSALAAALASGGDVDVRLWDRDAARARRLKRPRVGSVADLAGTLDGTRLALVAVTDAALPVFAEEMSRAWPAHGPRVVLHTAGAHPSSRLAPLANHDVALGVFHPVVSLLGARSAGRLAGAFVTLSGDEAAIRAGRRLARRLGMKPAVVDDRARPLVHLAAVLAAGDLVALLGEAARLLARAGLDDDMSRALLASLASGALDNWRAHGTAAALTGPVARGDAVTLRDHVAALPRTGFDGLAEVHRALALSGARALARAGALDAGAVRRVRRALEPMSK